MHKNRLINTLRLWFYYVFLIKSYCIMGVQCSYFCLFLCPIFKGVFFNTFHVKLFCKNYWLVIKNIGLVRQNGRKNFQGKIFTILSQCVKMTIFYVVLMLIFCLLLANCQAFNDGVWFIVVCRLYHFREVVWFFSPSFGVCVLWICLCVVLIF